jgi:Protein of unknown function VcgC/VcgE (DUF2780)
MDLIGTVTSALGIDSSAAEGAVGSVFKLLKQNAPADAFGAVEEKVPEAAKWMGAAPAPEGGGGALGGLLGAAAGALGGSLGQAAGPLGGLVASLSKSGVGGDALGKLVPLVLQFLQGRVGDGVVAKLVGSIPALAPFLGGSNQSGGASAASVLGSLFK